jgi:hypothetical protein
VSIGVVCFTLSLTRLCSAIAPELLPIVDRLESILNNVTIDTVSLSMLNNVTNDTVSLLAFNFLVSLTRI